MAKEESQCQRISINTAAEAAVPIISFTDNLHLGVCDALCEMHRLHDVLQFCETSLKNRIVKNLNTSFKTSHHSAKSAIFLVMFEVWSKIALSKI